MGDADGVGDTFVDGGHDADGVDDTFVDGGHDADERDTEFEGDGDGDSGTDGDVDGARCPDEDDDGFDRCNPGEDGDDGRLQDCDDGDRYETLTCDITGAGYYVDATNGNDENSGLSHDEAWKTLSKVNSYDGFEPGDDVFLLCGETWSQQKLVVDWGGTESNRTIVGAYYVLDGFPVIGVNDGGRPVIDGENTFPTTDFEGLIEIQQSTSYVTVQDLHARRSNKRGITVRHDAERSEILRCRVDETQDTNIRVNYGCTDSVVAYCESSRGGKSRVDDYLGERYGWPAGGIASTGSSGVVVRNNWVYDQYSEGITLGSDQAAFANVVGDTMSVGIYINGYSRSVIAYNLVFGTDDDTFNNIPSGGDYSNQSDFKGNGIVVGIERNEGYGNVEDVQVHHNIIINRGSGMRMYNSNATSEIISASWCNNLLIDNRYNIQISNQDDATDGDVVVLNNISYSSHPESSHVLEGTTGLDNWTIDYNLWAIHPAPTGDWVGAHDITENPLLGKTEWRGALESLMDFTIDDLVPTNGVDGQGLDLGPDFEDGLDSARSHFNTTDTVLDAIVVHTRNANDYAPWDVGPFVM